MNEPTLDLGTPGDPQSYAHLTRDQLRVHCAAFAQAVHDLSVRLSKCKCQNQEVIYGPNPSQVAQAQSRLSQEVA